MRNKEGNQVVVINPLVSQVIYTHANNICAKPYLLAARHHLETRGQLSQLTEFSTDEQKQLRYAGHDNFFHL